MPHLTSATVTTSETYCRQSNSEAYLWIYDLGLRSLFFIHPPFTMMNRTQESSETATAVPLHRRSSATPQTRGFSVSFFEIRKLKSRATREYDPLSRYAHLGLEFMKFHRQSSRETQLLIELAFEFFVNKIEKGSQANIVEIMKLQEIEAHLLGQSLISELAPYTAFFKRQLQGYW
ncbi:hypothetical protein BDP27DRAFT_923226 [Rhodocollybia butyracea]|uniref:Uncharacterized protein n=1 Tax=Rhodocollybia butyracea TaxID=206335 RepID=A0A9P5PRP4_9AGAR|nr:hypothetical protein BDP27DRAFT_923226 [Rhodocollybia butyracea]